MDGRAALRAVKGSAQGLAIHRRNTFDCAGKGLCPRDEALLKRDFIQRSEDQTKLIMARHPVLKGQKPAKKREFGPAEQRLR